MTRVVVTTPGRRYTVSPDGPIPDSARAAVLVVASTTCLALPRPRRVDVAVAAA